MIDQFIDLLDKLTQKIEESRPFLRQIKAHPELILTEMFDPSLTQPFYGFPYLLLGDSRRIDTENKLTYHMFQDYLLSLLNPYLQMMDSSIEVKLDSSYTFPASFTINVEQWTVLKFDPYYHTFTMVPNDTEDYYLSQIEGYQEQIAKQEEFLKDYKVFQVHPYQLCKTWKERFLVFRKKKKLLVSAVKMEEKARREIMYCEKYISENQEKYDQLVQAKEKLDEAARFWEKQFRETFHYRCKERNPIHHLEEDADAKAEI